MSLLESWVATPLARTVGWTLLHSLWEGAAIVAVLAAALVPMRSARARYSAAWVALLLLVGGIGFTLIRAWPEAVHGWHNPGTSPFSAWNASSDRPSPSTFGSGLAAVVPWLAPLWLVGVWISASWQLVGWISLCRLRTRGVCCAPPRWQNEVARLGTHLRMSRVVLLLESCLADVPMVLGQLRPVILMPLGLLAGLPTDQIEALLLHELAHIRRGDYLFNLLQRSVECLLFYHPAVWWISRVMRAERENCCDDIVVATTGKAGDYAEALAALEQLRGRGQEPAVAAAGGNLLKRIRRLLYPQGMSSSWTPLLVALILMATAVVALAAWPPKSPAQKFASAQRPPETAIAPGGAHLKPLPDEPLAHFRLSADSRRIYLALARLAGLNVVFTSDFQPQPTSINLSNVKIEDALDQVARETKTFWKPITYDTILVIPDTEQNRQKYAKGHESSPYDLWLYQEVVYIISDQERRAFEALTTDKERDAFINAFWEARNPHPGSPENAFKEEHYRRIGYANEHFASTAHAGWQTGRGHMYILYGPADEIESHPEGPPYPFEQWRYWHIEGRGDNVIFTFIDPGRTGDYRLAPAPSGKK